MQSQFRTMLTRSQVVDQSYLELRSYLLEIAAALDRYDRAPDDGSQKQDPRWGRIKKALEILAREGGQPDRVEELLMLFSDLTGLESSVKG